MMTSHANRIDLRHTKCPLNFVKAKLALEKLAVGDILEVEILTDGESAINIPNSLQQEGHTIVSQHEETPGITVIRVQRC
jgi:sulfite reductase (ferredoxin)